MDGSLSISGDCSANITVDVIRGLLDNDGGLFGDIAVTDRIDDGIIRVRGAVHRTAMIDIADMVTAGADDKTVLILTEAVPPGSFDFAGTLLLQSGIKQHQIVEITGRLTGLVNLNGQDVGGGLTLAGGGGRVANGGTITGSGFVLPVGAGITTSGAPGDGFSGEMAGNIVVGGACWRRLTSR